MKTKSPRPKLEAPLLDPAKRKHQVLSHLVPIEVNFLTEDSARQLGLEPDWYIQCAICDANSRVMVMDDAKERDLTGVVGSWMSRALEAKRLQKDKPAEREPGKMVEVVVQLPRAFAARMEEMCEADSITLAEAISHLTQEALGQQFDDNGCELDMLRRITAARAGEELP